MNKLFRHFILLALFIFAIDTIVAQNNKWRDIHKVKRKETIYSIAETYGLTVKELMDANPEMYGADFKLKKGSFVGIPHTGQTVEQSTDEEAEQVAQSDIATSDVEEVRKPQRSDARNREIRLGVMLPLNDATGIGKQMAEYYRGVLMACDSLRIEGISVDIKAWNINKDKDINTFLNENDLSDLDLIIGPYYAEHFEEISALAASNDTKLLVPYQMNVPDSIIYPTTYLARPNDSIYNDLISDNIATISDTCHTVIINCNDTTVQDDLLCKTLLTKLDAKGNSYTQIDLDASVSDFAAAFSKEKRNAVLLNTSLLKNLNIAFAKFNTLTITNDDIKIQLIGNTEWLVHTNLHLTNFYKYDTFIPSTFYMNPLSPRTARMNLKYRWNFHDDMINALPRFAMTGFDHAYFFIKGIKIFGTNFQGTRSAVGYTPLQTAMKFVPNLPHGYINHGLILIRYTPEYDIQTYTY